MKKGSIKRQIVSNETTIEDYVQKLIRGEMVVILSDSDRKEVQKRLREIKKNATIVLSQLKE